MPTKVIQKNLKTEGYDMFIKKMVAKLLKGNKYDSETYIKYLKSIGCKIGKDVKIYKPETTVIDETRPWLITIGNHVNITHGVTIETHGYDWAVLKTAYGDVLGSAGAVTIEDNVFIGMNTTILKGVHIGKNVIIGAGFWVNKDIPDNSVAVGNPCRVIMTLDEYYEKRKKAQLQESKEMVIKYRERYGKEPDAKALHEFYWLFSDNPDELDEVFVNMQSLCDNKAISDKRLRYNQKMFKNKEDFLFSIK